MRTRNRHISVWMNEREYRHLRAQAELAGMGIDPFIRSIVSSVQLRPRPPDTYTALLRELSAIGNNVNQIAYWANAQQSASEADIQEPRRWSVGRGGSSRRRCEWLTTRSSPSGDGWIIALPMPQTNKKPTLPPHSITSAMSGKPRRPMQTACGPASTARWRPLMQRCRRPSAGGTNAAAFSATTSSIPTPRRGHTAGGTRGRRGVCPPSAG